MTAIPQLLADLVRLPSVNPMGRTVESPLFYEDRVTDYLEQFFRRIGVPYERQSVLPQRSNIVARYEPAEPTCTILWEVHQDTVPVDAMTIDPFGGIIDKGKLYGRGACDVKGSMSAMLFALERLARERPAKSARVILACTVDEEHTFLGVQHLMNAGLRADFAIIAEPTSLDIVDAHKGVIRWKVETHGRACHSSRPEDGVNAIYHMGRILVAIERYASELRASRSMPRLGSPTLSVGRIEGGVSVNTVPDVSRIEIDRRLLPGEVPADAHRHFAEFLKSAPELSGIDYTVQPPWLSCPALTSDGSDELTRRLGVAIDSVKGKHSVRAVPFGTDASTIRIGGIPAVVFGPGDIAQAHTCNEWIDLNEVEESAEILYRLAVTSASK